MRKALISSMLGAGLSLAASGIGHAADLAIKAPQPLPAAILPIIWSGFYVGGNFGANTKSASGTSNFIDTRDNLENPQTNKFHTTQAIGGGQIGYNWQFDQRWVVGVEGDWSFTRDKYSFCRQTDFLAAVCFDNNRGFQTISSTTDWLATARGKVGFTWSNFLFYGTGGLAWGRVETSLTQSCLVGGCGAAPIPLYVSSTSAATKSGWVAGLGTEMQLDAHWSARLEWLHIELGSNDNALSSNGTAFSTQTTTWSRSERYDIIRVGVDYRFWSG